LHGGEARKKGKRERWGWVGKQERGSSFIGSLEGKGREGKEKVVSNCKHVSNTENMFTTHISSSS
jgi:hypothetical protein